MKADSTSHTQPGTPGAGPSVDCSPVYPDPKLSIQPPRYNDSVRHRHRQSNSEDSPVRGPLPAQPEPSAEPSAEPSTEPQALPAPPKYGHHPTGSGVPAASISALLAYPSGLPPHKKRKMSLKQRWRHWRERLKEMGPASESRAEVNVMGVRI